jgi:small-conductance mechanosensitive channel
MKPGDKVQMRDAPETQGIVSKIAGRQVIVRWSEHSSTKVPRYMLKTQQPKGENCHAR